MINGTIAIGRESRLAWATSRLSEALGGMAAILLLVWLVRGLLGIGAYSQNILLVSFGLIFLGRVFDTRTSSGAGRAVSSFLRNMAVASIVVIILIWFLGWVASLQADVLPAMISSRVPDLVIAAIATGLGAYAASKLSPERRTRASRPIFVVPEGKGAAAGDAHFVMKHDTVGMTIRRSGRMVGALMLGDLAASLETPMGPLTASLHGPVTTMGIPFEGRGISKEEVLRRTGKTRKQLLTETNIDFSGLDGFRREELDLPFVHVKEDEFERLVEVGPVKVREGPGGGHVKIGPLNFESEDFEELHAWNGWRGSRVWQKWAARGVGGSYVAADGRRVTAKWNGSSLSVDGDSMKLAVGSDSFSYSPAEVKTASPLHTLQVTADKITLDTRKFTLKVTGDSVVLRAEDKTSTTESKALAGDLRALLSETAKKQVKDVMEGTPIDLNEMLTSTEEVLARHG